jgi:Trk K+ transport system NAD-binding subunit
VAGKDRVVFIPRGQYSIEKGDILIILGSHRGMEKLSEQH